MTSSSPIATPPIPNVSAAFRYRAAKMDGSIEVGTVSAVSADAAAAMLATRGAWVLDVTVDSGSHSRARTLPMADLALGLRLLASFLESGLPIARALVALGDVAPDRWRDVLPSVQSAVRDGQSLASALSSAPVTLPPVVIGIVRAGEAGSGLARAVRRAAELTERQAGTRAALRAALAYPVILAIAGTAAVALLVGVVLPRFAAILSDLGQALPASTQAILVTAEIVRVGAIPGTVVVFLVVAGWYAWVATPTGRQRWDALLLQVPIVGPIRRSAAAARFAAALSSLLESGVPPAPALRSAAEACGDAEVAARLRQARELVVGGQPLSQALRNTGGVTLTTIRLVRAGEESGALADMLHHAATLDGEHAERTLKQAVRLLEPVLILVFGAMVAFVAAALLQAVYSVRPGGM